ncbi:hypothetical protein [Methylobacterium radiotolerans]
MRVTISGALMVCDCEDSGFPMMAFPVRPKPEVEFWLCAQGHAGWTAGGTRAYLRTFPHGQPIHKWYHWVDFAEFVDGFLARNDVAVAVW